MKLKNTAFTGGDQTHSELCQTDITAIRKHVISGDWTAINNHTCTLTDLGLRHNGSGLVWLGSGVSVHEADVDTGFGGSDKVSFDYHNPLWSVNSLKNNGESTPVQCQNIDSYCQNIIFSCTGYREFCRRKDGKPLATFAVQIEPQQRKAAPAEWVIYRSPNKCDKYELLHLKRHAGLIKEYECQGWKREPLGYVGDVIRDNAEFGRLMMRLGYVQVRTRKITGKKETFWLYRSSHRELVIDTPLRPQEPLPRKVSCVTVQASESERFAFKRVAVDGRYLWVYADHIRFLKKIRTRVNGKQVQGYSAQNVNLIIEVSDSSALCKRNLLSQWEIAHPVQRTETQYTPALLGSMTQEEMLTAAKSTLIAINGESGVGMVAHSIMLKHGGRNLASVPQANLAGCLVDLDKLLNTAKAEVAA